MKLVQLRVRVFALENLVISSLAEAPDRQLDLAREMAARTNARRRSKKIPTIFTIGHSTLPIAEFLALLQEVGVDLLVAFHPALANESAVQRRCSPRTAG